MSEPDERSADPRWGDLDADPALAAAVLEIEEHLADGGWDQPARLYALVDTASLALAEPALAAALGIDGSADAGSLTPIEQDELAPDRPLESVLETIEWPEAVAGCAAMVERLVLPPGSDVEVPDDPEAAQAFAREHPDRQEVRIVAAATRSGSTYCALRLRAHDDPASVVGGVDMVPGLIDLLRATLSLEPLPRTAAAPTAHPTDQHPRIPQHNDPSMGEEHS